MVEKVVSGGQTGVDRAALDTALERGISIGGWCPKGRRAEDGSIPARYPLKETPLEKYAQRTAWNVRDSDATLVLLGAEPVGGTLLTLEEAREQGRPHLVVRLGKESRGEEAKEWLSAEKARVLNVAGPRESEEPGIYERARSFLNLLFIALADKES